MDRITVDSIGRRKAHPWMELSGRPEIPDDLSDGHAIELIESGGQSLGCGIIDRSDSGLCWRRYSLAEGVAFDAGYLLSAITESMHRRGDETCQRLVSSDADYLPGLVVELFGDLVFVSFETTAVRSHCTLICEMIKELVNPSEIVLEKGDGPQTFSGQGLKGRWVDVDDLFYRIDLLNPEKARFYLDQREQHALFGSLCSERAVLDLFSHSGAFAMQAMRAGASKAVAVDSNESFIKGIRANVQRNELDIEAVAGDALDYLGQVKAGDFDAIVIDPPEAFFADQKSSIEIHRRAFEILPEGGLLATYCRGASEAEFDSTVNAAAAESGREARVFAKTSQPFDFPVRLNFPESQSLKGLIIEVE